MEVGEGEGGCGRRSPPPTNYPPSSEDEFEFVPDRRLAKLIEEVVKREGGVISVRVRRLANLIEQVVKREVGGAPLTNSALPSPAPAAAESSCGFVHHHQQQQQQQAGKGEEDTHVDKDEEEEDYESDSPPPYFTEPPMPKEYWIRYFQQVEESEGFDVDDFPGRPEDNLLGPVGSPYDDDQSVEVGQHAINSYNMRKKDALIEFVRVVKIISKYDGWMPQYVTLEGRDIGDNKIKTYQALVLIVPELVGYVLKMFRLKPSAEMPTSKEKKHPLGECCGQCLHSNAEQDDEVGPEHETLLPPAKKPRVENDEEQLQDHLQPQSSDNSSPSKDDCNDDYDSDDRDPVSYKDIIMRNFEISLDAPVNGFESVEEAEGFMTRHFKSDDNHLDRKSPQGGPKYTLDDLERYYEQLDDSQGFDIDYFPEMENLQFITPVRDEEVVNNRFTEHAKLAIEFHNKEEGAQLQLRKIIKVNCLNINCCPHAYITFEAIDAADVHDEPKTYQARILTIPGRMKVEEVRLKP